MSGTKAKTARSKAMAGQKNKGGDGAAEKLLDADAAAVDAVEPYRDSPLVEALSTFSEVGDQPQMRILCGGLIAAGLARGDARMIRAGTRMLAAHTVATLAKDFIKHRVDRTRPAAMIDEDADHRPKAGGSRDKKETSFPSGHSAGAAAVARAFARDYPEHALPALAAGGAISLAQIPRCAHYPTDVGAGIAIGLAAEAAVTALGRRFAGGS
jgi:membrane-associated phospholipid phosphatase